MIPNLDIYSGSWIVQTLDGQVVGEFFNRDNLLKFNPNKVTFVTAYQYLCSLNK